MPVRHKKNTRRGRKLSRKVRRKMTRKMRGGSSGAAAGPNTYTFTVATPITSTSTATGFPAALGVFSAGDQGIGFSNPTKKIVDIKVKNGAAQYGASSFSTSAGSKVSIKIGGPIGAIDNLVSKGVVVRGTTALPGAAATTGMTGPVRIKGLGASSFGTMPPVLTFEVFTSN